MSTTHEPTLAELKYGTVYVAEDLDGEERYTAHDLQGLTVSVITDGDPNDGDVERNVHVHASSLSPIEVSVSRTQTWVEQGNTTLYLDPRIVQAILAGVSHTALKAGAEIGTVITVEAS